MNPDASPPRSPVLLLGDDWDVRPKRPRVVVLAAVIVVALIVTGFGLLRSREQVTKSDDQRDWRPIGLLPAALSRDTEFHAPPAPAPNRSPAYLSINSRPWAELSIDGVVLGNTPQIKIRVIPGRHHVSLAREGFETHISWVVVPAGGNVRLTDITLTAATR